MEQKELYRVVAEKEHLDELRRNRTVRQIIENQIATYLADIKGLENLQARLSETLLNVTENDLYELIRLSHHR